MLQVNPMDIIMAIQRGQNPQQIMLDILSKEAASNPVAANLLDMAKSNRTADIEKFARNVFQASGRDFDKEFKEFQQRYFGANR